AGVISFNQELPLSTTSFIVNISGDDGDALLRDLAILENGLTIPANRLNFRTGQTANNPILIPAGDQGGFTYEIEITPDVAAAGDATYEFRLTDVDGELATTSVIITFTVNPPSISLISDASLVSGDTTISSFDTKFDVAVALVWGDDFIRSLEVLANGEIIPAEQLFFNGGDFISNPILFEGDLTNTTFRVGVDQPNVTGTTQTYIFRVTDAGGNSSELSFTVVFDTPETDLTFDTTGVFFNASGGMNGGLDLDNGMAVSFNSGDAEIQDEGIDLNSAGENWRTQVSVVDPNDTELRIADLSAIGDGLTFNDVLLTSQISAAFDGGSVPDGNDNFPDADGDTSANEVVTQPLQEGDVLVVRRGDRTYLVRIDTITFAAGSNNDSYTVSIKY
ncbi:MAG: hypothetical protein AAF597_17220, partial [Bacteroidota bacterium]